MNSLILRTTARYLLPMLLLFSVFLLLRGHHEPGGGFTGGLVAGAAWALYALAYDARAMRSALPCAPHILIGGGLLVALASGVLGLFLRQPFLTGQWFALPIPGLGKVDVGSPLIFDFGVYLLVWGIVLMVVLVFAEE